jgi:lipoyl(octanoyl) transferase
LSQLVIEDLGRRDYGQTLLLQRELAESRAQGAIPDRVLLVEHPPVYTAGRGTKPGDVLAGDTEVVAIERGGRVTWHGPGQLVIYPIVRLDVRGRDLHQWLRRLEQLGIDILSRLGVTAGRSELGTGVFVGGRKIGSIGIAVKRWVSLHGLAVNIDLDLLPFTRIRPCGFDAGIMTTASLEAGRSVAMDEARAAAHDALAAGL